MNQVPESNTLVIDFSYCRFVDYTVQEHLSNYQDSFKQNGGTLEIKGLDGWGEDSKHPYAIKQLIGWSQLPKKMITGKDRTLRQTQLHAFALNIS